VGTLLASKLRKKNKSGPTEEVAPPTVDEVYMSEDRDSTDSNVSWASAEEEFEDEVVTPSPPATAPSSPTISDNAIINYLDLLITTYHNEYKRLLSSVTIDVPFIYQILHYILNIIDTSNDIDTLLTAIGDSNNGIIKYVLGQLQQRIDKLTWTRKKLTNTIIARLTNYYLENEKWNNKSNASRLITLKDIIENLVGGELNIELTSVLSAVINEKMEEYLRLMEFEQEEQEQITLIVNKYLTDKAGFLSILSELKEKNVASAGGYKIKSKKANKSIKRKNKSFKKKSFKRKKKSIKGKRNLSKGKKKYIKRNLSKRKKSIN
jgi:hypothetical protein